MIICQLTDMHIRAPGSLAYGRVDTNGYFAAAIAELKTLSPAPDVYVLTGDLTDFGRADEYQTLAQGVAQLGKPSYLLPGNHDEREALRRAFPNHGYLQGDAPFDLRWHVSDKSGRQLFFNIIIEGINMLASERTEIGAILDKNGGDVDKLTAVLQQT